MKNMKNFSIKEKSFAENDEYDIDRGENYSLYTESTLKFKNK